MRASKLISISLPPKLLRASDALAKSEAMTRSELVREALRSLLMQKQTQRALRTLSAEKKTGSLKDLGDGSLADFLR